MQYMVTGSDGIEYGPVDEDTLKSWAGEGRVVPNTKVRDVMSQQVFRATDVSALRGILPEPAAVAPPTNYQLPPAMSSGYPRDMGFSTPMGRSRTRLWGMIFWVVVGLLLAIFTGGKGFIIAAFSLYDAYRAHDEGDNNSIACIIIGVVGAILIIGINILRFNR
jgi:hypothetical protein